MPNVSDCFRNSFSGFFPATTKKVSGKKKKISENSIGIKSQKISGHKKNKKKDGRGKTSISSRREWKTEKENIDDTRWRRSKIEWIPVEQAHDFDKLTGTLDRAETDICNTL